MELFKDEFYGTLNKEYHAKHSMLGAPTSPQTANQIAEATSRLNAGVKNIELSTVSPEIFDAIPKQHFREIKRLADVTGSEVSLHAPIFEPAGFAKEGWSETERRKGEYMLIDSLEKAHDLNPNGNTMVTMHSSGGVPAYEWQKKQFEDEEGLPEGGKRMMVVVNRETGQMAPLKYEEKKYIGKEKPEIWDPEKRRNSLNQTSWDEEKLRLFNLEKQKAEVQERLTKIELENAPLSYGSEKGILMPEEIQKFQNNKMNANLLQNHIGQIDQHLYSGMQEINNKFEKYASEEDKELTKQKIKNFNQVTKNYGEQREFTEKTYNKEVKKLREELNLRGDNLNGEDIKKLQSQIPMVWDEVQKKIKQKYGEGYVTEDRILDVMSKLSTPEIFVSTDKFAQEKTAQTVANAAFEAYKKFGDKTPIIAMENVHPDWTLGRADSLKKAIEDSREGFAKKLMKEKHISEGEARKTAEKLIGATWDVGHINMLRKFGYDDKDIVDETKRIAKFVKHTHLTDNFGFSDSHLPPGMGNVPIKDMLQELEKQGFKGKGIVEAGNFVQHFKQSPHPYTVRYLSSPLYSEKAEPYWSQVAEVYGTYNTGFGTMLPEKHFEMYGAGFSNLPQELGGQVQNDKSRFSGTPNQ
ncbi:MAG: hypothetical protein KJ674_01775 [Nanoarchaeota archaeon]|nr:hypothetical protein [Nanoarchaeota archaeon]